MRAAIYLSVKCLTCGAPPHKQCKRERGDADNFYHQPRWDRVWMYRGEDCKCERCMVPLKKW